MNIRKIINEFVHVLFSAFLMWRLKKMIYEIFFYCNQGHWKGEFRRWKAQLQDVLIIGIIEF